MQREVECVRCHTIRSVKYMRVWSYEGQSGWLCTGKTACKNRRKMGNKLFRTELFQRRNDYLEVVS